MNSPLNKLLADENALIDEAVATGLQPLIAFTPSGQLILQPAFPSLSAPQKVLGILLAIKAQSLLKIRPTEDASPKELAEMSGIPPGTMNRTLRELEDQKLASSSNGRYRIPIYSLNIVLDLLKDNGG